MLPHRTESNWNANFDEEMVAFLPAMDLLKSKEATMRDYAFSEKEAMAYVRKKTGSKEFMTMAQEIESYREMLKLKEQR